jgi:hypothetical protein
MRKEAALTARVNVDRIFPKSAEVKFPTLAGALNPHPEVRDRLFNENPFFVPKDLVQVRYEMVRRHEAQPRICLARLNAPYDLALVCCL